MVSIFGKPLGNPLKIKSFNFPKRKVVSNLASSRSKKLAPQPEKKVNPLYAEFLSSLSSTEQEAYQDVERAMPAFRKWLENKSDAELVALVTK